MIELQHPDIWTASKIPSPPIYESPEPCRELDEDDDDWGDIDESDFFADDYEDEQ